MNISTMSSGPVIAIRIHQGPLTDEELICYPTLGLYKPSWAVAVEVLSQTQYFAFNAFERGDDVL